MNKTLAWLVVPLGMLGCTFGAEDGVEVGGESLGTAEDEASSSNTIFPNTIFPNLIYPDAIYPGAIAPSRLAPAFIPAEQLAALQDPGEAGALSRMLVKYLVSCAFSSSSSFSFSWTEPPNIVHNETYWGALGLAPNWVNTGLTESEQRWVSACIASRTNYYGTMVMISMRGTHGSLGADTAEKEEYPIKEGAFWGNMFIDEPYLTACWEPANVAAARAEDRECAAGHWDGSSVIDCGNIRRIGTCDNYCVDRTDPSGVADDGFASCDGVSEVIATYLED